MLRDYHIHTTYCDGKSTAEETVLVAINRGFSSIGFSGHSYTWFDETWCMSKDSTQKYIADIHALSEKYRGEIEILCGIEQDYYSEESSDVYDYIIGSVHYLKFGNDFLMVDESADWLRHYANEYFDGDFYSLTDLYYETVENIVDRTGCDYIGHFDVISKFNESNQLFDEQNERYRNAWRTAADKLLKTDKIFEINTGAMASGYRKSPYPSSEIFEYLRERGAKFILASDCHKAEKLGYGFETVKASYGIPI